MNGAPARLRTLALALAAVLVVPGAAAPGFGAPTAPPQAGTVHERLVLDSEVMGAPVHYTVYLPPDYGTSSRSYPIVYLLHGYSDDDTGWVQMGQMNRILDAAIADGTLPPMVVVMPDGGVSWYIDSADGEVPWESMFLQELMPHVEAGYRVRDARRFRAIAGLSMGGWGALTLSMRHPDLFAGAAAFSAAVFADDGLMAWRQEGYDAMLGPVFGRGLEGEARLSEHFRAHSPLAIAESVDPESLRRLALWIDCGDDDFLSAANGDLHAILTRREIAHEYRVRDGAHVWEYWRTGLVSGLQHATASFR